MNGDRDLYLYRDGLIGHQDRNTSVEAAEKGRRRAAALAEKVRRLFEIRGNVGATDDELIVWFGTADARPRRIGLMHKKIVKDSGEKRMTRFDRKAVVWKLAQYVPSKEGVE